LVDREVRAMAGSYGRRRHHRSDTVTVSE
jgi:hypothetical protein